ncbi:hypothetical protein NEUTE2DRAFT_73640 [Neurospora tetrasperma FGSC 2509]|nr:hypothetical protein NEUTE2DRAFT_73640 [Neurospora tetrasperma FGSC 2509]
MSDEQQQQQQQQQQRQQQQQQQPPFFGGCDSGLETALCATRRGRSSLAGLAWLQATTHQTECSEAPKPKWAQSQLGRLGSAAVPRRGTLPRQQQWSLNQGPNGPNQWNPGLRVWYGTECFKCPVLRADMNRDVCVCVLTERPDTGHSVQRNNVTRWTDRNRVLLSTKGTKETPTDLSQQRVLQRTQIYTAKTGCVLNASNETSFKYDEMLANSNDQPAHWSALDDTGNC